MRNEKLLRIDPFYSVVQELAHAIHYRKFVHEGFRIFDLEYAFVVEEDYQNIADACKVYSCAC